MKPALVAVSGPEGLGSPYNEPYNEPSRESRSYRYPQNQFPKGTIVDSRFKAVYHNAANRRSLNERVPTRSEPGFTG
jgi:hypothetical protein